MAKEGEKTFFRFRKMSDMPSLLIFGMVARAPIAGLSLYRFTGRTEGYALQENSTYRCSGKPASRHIACWRASPSAHCGNGDAAAWRAAA